MFWVEGFYDIPLSDFIFFFDAYFCSPPVEIDRVNDSVPAEWTYSRLWLKISYWHIILVFQTD